ncbi:hypothetical protein ACCO45_001684 [Purpureocillium lilacinum]|uniref:Uncharacterized protein n=1 Tax=Purpureocillium lilacinum TaxID=33203 RepID=A0ACC4E7P7_PURLI
MPGWKLPPCLPAMFFADVVRAAGVRASAAGSRALFVPRRPLPRRRCTSSRPPWSFEQPRSPGALELEAWGGTGDAQGAPSAAHHPSSPIGALPWHATTTGRPPALFSLPSPERDREKTQPTTTIDDDERRRPNTKTSALSAGFPPFAARKKKRRSNEFVPRAPPTTSIDKRRPRVPDEQVSTSDPDTPVSSPSRRDRGPPPTDDKHPRQTLQATLRWPPPEAIRSPPPSEAATTTNQGPFNGDCVPHHRDTRTASISSFGLVVLHCRYSRSFSLAPTAVPAAAAVPEL